MAECIIILSGFQISLWSRFKDAVVEDIAMLSAIFKA